jgi:hypothetical protein
MMNIQIYSSDFYLTGSIDEALQIVRQRTRIIAAEHEGSDEAGIRYLGWPVPLVQPLFDAPVSSVEMGAVVATIPLDDIKELSFFRFGLCLEYIAVRAIEHLGSNPEIAEFYHLHGETPVRRAKNLRGADVVRVRTWLLGSPTR